MPLDIISGELNPKYKQTKLRERILDVIRDSRVTQGMPPETVPMRRTDRSSYCRVFVVATAANTSDDVRFTNYSPALSSSSPATSTRWHCAKQPWHPPPRSHFPRTHDNLPRRNQSQNSSTAAFTKNNPPVAILWRESPCSIQPHRHRSFPLTQSAASSPSARGKFGPKVPRRHRQVRGAKVHRTRHAN